ncbi:MAG TPA: hypothetical protein VN873_19620 [Candidatus Angelobacter sp.]|nr:hypothetical protein [Candidatus Angelobacter sp.]
MPEFKFTCPECKRQVVCDIGYAGSRIHCPICQKNILVPPSTEPALQIRVSTLKKAGLISACGLLAIAIVYLGLPLFGPKTLTFRASVDGSDVVKLSGGKLWVEHLTWQQPTKMTINGKAWTPTWIDNGIGMQTMSVNASALPAASSSTAPYGLSRAFKPGSPEKIKLTKRVGRGKVSIVQRPDSGNNQTVAILLDDGPMGGAADYEFTLSW